MEPAVLLLLLLLLLLLSKGQENAGRFAEGPRSSGGREGRESRKMAKKRSKIATTEAAAAAAPPAVGFAFFLPLRPCRNAILLSRAFAQNRQTARQGLGFRV